MRGLIAGIALLVAAATPALAHPLAPALLQLDEVQAGQYEVLWRTSATRVRSVDVAPQLPAHCRTTRAPALEAPNAEALVARWRVDCGAAGLAGETISVQGLDGSGINVIVRLQPATGDPVQALLHAREPGFTVPPPLAGAPVFGAYLVLGGEHLLLGFDHVLFVAGLVLLLRRWRPLLVTITAFTLGHSLTLAMATLGWVSVDPRPVELGIAASILLLACELSRGAQAGPSWWRRAPWLMACAFGLLHGLGFAGALAQAGLPQGEIPLALLAFNLGVEAAQLALVALLLAAVMLWQRRPPLLRTVHGLPMLASYLVGTLAAFWCFERAADWIA